MEGSTHRASIVYTLLEELAKQRRHTDLTNHKLGLLCGSAQSLEQKGVQWFFYIGTVPRLPNATPLSLHEEPAYKLRALR